MPSKTKTIFCAPYKLFRARSVYWARSKSWSEKHQLTLLNITTRNVLMCKVKERIRVREEERRTRR